MAVARRWRLGISSLGAFGDPQRERLELAEESSEPPRLLEPSAVALELLVGEVATDGLGVDLAGPVVVGAVEHGWVAYVANDDARLRLDPAVVIAVVVANIVVSHRPLYGIGEWVSTFEPGLFGLAPGDAQALNDDRVGRMLDRLFDADRATLITETVLSVVREFQVELGRLHNDATALHMQGEYSSSVGDSPRAPRVRFGHAKERPDLAQLIYLLTVSADGYVPITYRLADGNTPEDPTHIATWESCCVLAGTTMFLYVADAKLCSRSAMGHIDKHHGRFLCVMPATRAEAGEFCRFIARNTPEWTEVARRPGKRKDDPDEVIYSTPAPSPSVEGYRICWFYSTTKELDDAAKRGRSIEAARVALKPKFPPRSRAISLATRPFLSPAAEATDYA